MIAAPRSGSGKTTVTLGFLRAFRRRGVDVVGRQVRPRLYRPGLPCRGVGAGRRQSRLLGDGARPSRCARRAGGARMPSLLVRSLDGSVRRRPGRPGAPARRPTWRRASACRSCWSSTSPARRSRRRRSCKGCARYDARLQIAGVIVNRVGSERHRRLVGDAIEAMGIPVVGALPRDATDCAARAPSRPGAGGRERGDSRRGSSDRRFRRGAMSIAPGPRAGAPLTPLPSAAPRRALRPPGQRIALARDAAFSFIYPHLVEAGGAAGAEIVPFSPLADEPPPQIATCCWLPGGYPELHAGRLAGGARFRAGLTSLRRRRARFMANAGAIWRWAKASTTPRARAIRWRACLATDQFRKSAG